MNSTKLKKDFPEIYEQFFSLSQKVASAPHSFLWTGDFSGFFGGITVLSKIPLRFYVGLEKISANKFEIEKSFPAYSSISEKFEEVYLESYLIDALENLFAETLKGYRIKFLSEVTLGKSLGSLGAISACFAKLICEKDTKIFPEAQKFVKKLQRGRTSSATAYAAVCESAYPVVFYSKGDRAWGKPLDKLIKLPSTSNWPIDFGLIYSGKLVEGAAVIASADEVKRVSEVREKVIEKLVGHAQPFWTDYLAMLDQVAYQNLAGVADLFEKGSREDALKFFFSTLNQYQNLLHFLEISLPSIDRIYSRVHQIASASENRVGSGAKITGVGKGGEVLFAVPFGQYRDKFNREFKLDYASWIDGPEQKGVLLEQDIAKNAISEFIKKGSLLVKIFGASESVRIARDISEVKADLILDCHDGKIYLKGRGVTSKDLPSQKAAIEILSKLFGQRSRKLKNQQLPAAYSKNRFDLQSKVTSKLEKLIPIKFEITGGMYDDYSLSLISTDATIAIASKI